jgi:hypothetical protein
MIDVQFLYSRIHFLNLTLDRHPFRLQVSMQAQDFSIDGEAIFDSPINN